MIFIGGEPVVRGGVNVQGTLMSPSAPQRLSLRYRGLAVMTAAMIDRSLFIIAYLTWSVHRLTDLTFFYCLTIKKRPEQTAIYYLTMP